MTSDFQTTPPDSPGVIVAQHDRIRVQHLLIGPPQAVRQTIERLQHCRYSEVNRWSRLIEPPGGERLILTLERGDVMSVYLRSIPLG